MRTARDTPSPVLQATSVGASSNETGAPSPSGRRPEARSGLKSRARGDATIVATHSVRATYAQDAGDGTWEELIERYLSRAESSPTPAERIHFLERAASVHADRLNRPSDALDTLLVAWRADYANERVANRLEGLAADTSRWADLLNAANEGLASRLETNARVALCGRCASWYGEILGREDDALPFHEQLLDLDPGRLSLRGIRALEASYRQQRDWPNLALVLEAKANAESDPTMAREARLTLAELHRYMGDDVQAIAIYEEIAATDPGNARVLFALDALYSHAGRLEQLPDVLERRIVAAAVEKDRVDLLMRLGQLWDRSFLKPQHAIDSYERVLSIAPRHAPALNELERLYREAGDWEKTVEVLQRRATSTIDMNTKASLYRSIGTMCAQQLSAPDRAIAAYERAVALCPDDSSLLQTLAALHEKSGDTAKAIDVTQRMLEQTHEPSAQVPVLVRLGELHEPTNWSAALDCYARALDRDPHSLPSLRAIRKVHLNQGDWQAARRSLEAELACEDSPRSRAQRHVELGQLLGEKLKDATRGAWHYAQALEWDPGNRSASLALAGHYVSHKRWQDALPHLTHLLHAPCEDNPEDTLRAACWLGEVATATDDLPLSVQSYDRALQVNPDHAPALFAGGESHFQMGNWHQARHRFQTLLTLEGHKLPEEQAAEASWRLGLIYANLDDKATAIRLLTNSLKRYKRHRPTLEALTKLHTEEGNFKQVLQLKERLLRWVDGDERVLLMQEMALLYRRELGSDRKAISLLWEAANEAPNDRNVLCKLLEIYQDKGRWREAVRILDRVTELEPHSNSRAQFLYTAGVILRDKLNNPQGACEYFEEALDLNGTRLKTFEALSKILTETRDFAAQERAYRKMIHRLAQNATPDENLLYELWHQLGIIYRDRLGDLSAASEAFQMASTLRPKSTLDHQILAELYSHLPRGKKHTAEHLQRMIAQTPKNPAPYHELFEQFLSSDRVDQAFCVARALVHLNSATPDERAFHEAYRHTEKRVTTPLKGEGWARYLYHPTHNKALALVYRCLAGSTHQLRYGTVTDRAAGLTAAKPMKNDSELANPLREASRVLTPDLIPRFFLHSAGQHGFRSVMCASQASLAGHRVLNGTTPAGLRFYAGHHLAYHRAEFFLSKMLPSHQELSHALRVALRSIGVGVGTPQEERNWAQLREAMTAQQIEALKKSCHLYMKSGARSDFKDYRRTTELTACRAGLLTSDDLGASLASLEKLDEAGPDDPSPAEKAQDLLSFSVSEVYFRLRRRSGYSIDP